MKKGQYLFALYESSIWSIRRLTPGSVTFETIYPRRFDKTITGMPRVRIDDIVAGCRPDYDLAPMITGNYKVCPSRILLTMRIHWAGSFNLSYGSCSYICQPGA